LIELAVLGELLLGVEGHSITMDKRSKCAAALYSQQELSEYCQLDQDQPGQSMGGHARRQLFEPRQSIGVAEFARQRLAAQSQQKAWRA
jgi:hypothetical protein